MVTLHHQNRVRKQGIDQRRVPHQLPAFLRFGLETLQLPARESQAVIETERLEVGHVAVQYVSQRVPMQEADVVTFVEGIDENLPVHGLRDYALVVKRAGREFEGG